MNGQIAVRALKNLCTFIGAIALFSYFYNFMVDLRHWYVTLASALACGMAWFGFYVIEARGGVRPMAWLSRLLSKSELAPRGAEISALPADPPRAADAPNPLPWLNASGAANGEKESAQASG